MNEENSETPFESNKNGDSSESLVDGDVGSEVQPERSEGSSPASASSVVRNREVTVNTIVRLMGLPTSSDIRVLESKLDALTSKLASIAVRLDRVSSQVLEISHDSDRVDLQISDLRAFVKKALASVVVDIERATAKNNSGKKKIEAEVKPIIASSEGSSAPEGDVKTTEKVETS
ncbi:MAG: hypothetical protein IT291_00675 [Deltaproteobacteria bacterium]|nr:hypothetical protein [Deltaproteobacteria bacterium]